MAEKARVPPSRFSTIHIQADGPTADAMGTTVSWWLAGSSVTSPFSTRAPASSGVSAQPSAITAARIERRNGSHTSAQPIGGPQWMIVRSPMPGTTSAAGARPTRRGTPVSRRRTTSALASSMAAARGAVEAAKGGHRLGVASGRDAPVDVGHRSALGGDRLGEERQPDVHDGDVVGQEGTEGSLRGEALTCPMVEESFTIVQWRAGAGGRRETRMAA